MKRWNLIFKPFTRIAGWQAFILGLVFVALSGVIGTYAQVLFDGVLDAHITDQAVGFKTSFVLLGIDIVCITVVMYLAGMIISKQTRMIDILGTMTLARAPMLLLAIAGLFVTPISGAEIMQNPMVIFGDPLFILFTLLAILLVVWFVALMYNAFKVSTGEKGGRLIAAFIIGLILAESLSKILVIVFLKNMG